MIVIEQCFVDRNLGRIFEWTILVLHLFLLAYIWLQDRWLRHCLGLITAFGIRASTHSKNAMTKHFGKNTAI